MRTTESRSSRVTVDLRPLRPPQPPEPVAADEEGFGPVVGALIGILISVPLWVLIGVVILLLRR
jgi:hypothetical protein